MEGVSEQTEQPRQPDENRVVVITPEGMGVAEPRRREESAEPENPADLVEQPAKVMRIGAMIKNLLDEVRNAPLDEAGRSRLAEIHTRSIAELKDGLAPELVEELDRIALPFGDERPQTRSYASPRPSSWGGWKGCSTASRPLWLPSRWPLSSSWPVCAGRCPQVTPKVRPVCRVPRDASSAPATSRASPARPASTSRPVRLASLATRERSEDAVMGPV